MSNGIADIQTKEDRDLQQSTDRSAVSHSKELTEKDRELLRQMGITTADFTKESVGSYARGNAVNAWAEEVSEYKKKAWNETTKGRFAIRCFSRGVMGALLYSVMQVKATNDMTTYNPEKSWSELNKEKAPWLQYIAKFIDSTAGKAISKTAGFMGLDPHAAVSFRPTRKYYPSKDNVQKFGRSLGHEAVGITSDFAAMSIGDGLVRDYIAPMLDPSVKLSWVKRETVVGPDGKEHEEKHIDFVEALKSTVKAAWRLISYNAGEDIAVAIPYAYYLRGQRNLINRISPGFGFDSDNALNGGSFKVNDKGEIVGNYNVEGMIDLTGRFTAYNVGTLMYRELYNHIGKSVNEFTRNGTLPSFKMPESIGEAVERTLDAAYKTVRYVVGSTVIATGYMLPSAALFGFIRSSQSKDIGLAIHPTKGKLYFEKEGYKLDIHANGSLNGTGKTDVRKDYYERDVNNTAPKVFIGHGDDRVQVDNPFAFDSAEKFKAFSQVTGKFDYVTNMVGGFSHNIFGGLSKGVFTTLADASTAWSENPEHRKKVRDAAKDYSRRFSKASLSYTPYFFVKSDVLSRKIDKPGTRMGFNRAFDGLVEFNMGEFSAGVSEMWRAIQDKPLENKAREVELQKEMKEDITAPDGNSDLQTYTTYPNIEPAQGYSYITQKYQGNGYASEMTRARTPQDIVAEKQKEAASNIWAAREAAMRKAKDQNAPTTTSLN